MERDIERGDIVRLAAPEGDGVREYVVVGVIEWYTSYPGEGEGEREPTAVEVRLTEEVDGYGPLTPFIDLELEEFTGRFEERLGRLDFERGEEWVSPRRREGLASYADALEE